MRTVVNAHFNLMLATMGVHAFVVTTQRSMTLRQTFAKIDAKEIRYGITKRVSAPTSTFGGVRNVAPAQIIRTLLLTNQPAFAEVKPPTLAQRKIHASSAVLIIS